MVEGGHELACLADVDAVADIAGCDTVDSFRYLAYGPRGAARCDGADYRRSYHGAQQRQGRCGLPAVPLRRPAAPITAKIKATEATAKPRRIGRVVVIPRTYTRVREW